MTALQQLQVDFLDYLLGKPSAIVDDIVSTGNVTNRQRLDLYADSYRLRLQEAISTDYPQLQSYLGDENYQQLVDAYIDRYTSHHPSLRYYSQFLPQLLADTDPWQGYPELYELSCIEKAFCDSFDAADCEPATQHELVQLQPDSWPELTLEFAESVQLLSLNCNSFQIWQALADDETPPQAGSDPGNWLIWRCDLVSKYEGITEVEAYALDIMMHGSSFSALCEGLLDYFDAEETPQQAVNLLQGWVSRKMVCRLNT